MKAIFLNLFLIIGSFSIHLLSKPILIVTTDIGQDPDDEQSLVRLLHYADQFNIAGIIANADNNHEHEQPILKDRLVHSYIDAYAKIENNLRSHSPGFPTAAYLHSIVKKGCAGNGNKVPVNKYVGDGLDTEGSEWLIKIVDHSQNEPIHIAIWGGACDLAQALWKVKTTRTSGEVANFAGKLRVYFIGKQDSSNDWIIENFPEMWLILSENQGGDRWESAYRGMFWGGNMDLTSQQWIQNNLLEKNPLSNLYPRKAFTNQNPHGSMKEGDSPSFLYFLDNGLNQPEYPSWGGWGGRYTKERNQFFRDSPDFVYDPNSKTMDKSGKATVYRWRADFQNDFAARVQWGATSRYNEANHYPIVLIDGFANSGPIEYQIVDQHELSLNASFSFDPDGDSLRFDWFIYPEAGSYPGIDQIHFDSVTGSKVKLSFPEIKSGNTIHLICRITDRHKSPLHAYKRIVLHF